MPQADKRELGGEMTLEEKVREIVKWSIPGVGDSFHNNQERNKNIRAITQQIMEAVEEAK